MRLNSLGYAIGQGARSILRNRTMSFASVATTTVSLLILAVFAVAVLNLDHMAAVIEQDVQIIAYLDGGLTEVHRTSIGEALAGMEGVTMVAFVSKEDAFAKLREVFAEQQELLDAVDPGTLRESFHVKVDHPSRVEPVALGIAGLAGVEEVDWGRETVAKLFQLTRLLRLAALGAIGLLASATVFIINSTIRLTVFARRREIVIMKLVGATDWFIRWPFVAEGVFLGLAGAILAGGAVVAGYVWLTGAAHVSVPFLPLLPPYPLLRDLSVALAAGGCLLGAMGSVISIHRFLRA